MQVGAAPARTPHVPVRPAAPAGDAAAADPAFQVLPLDWQDRSRDRAVPALLYWPRPAQHRSRSLVVFSHGLGSARDGYSYLGRFWARQGIASLHVQHVGSDRALWEGNPAGLHERFRKAASDAEAIARAQDMSFALDQLLASAFGAQIDPAGMVAAGHSYGANTTLLLAGARVSRAGRIVDVHDPRFSAAILISAPPFYGEPEQAAILSGIAIPTLHITTTDDQILIPGFESGVLDRRRVFDAMRGFKVLAVYRHGSHNVFTERRYFDSVAVTNEVKSATESLTLAFLKEVLVSQPALRDWARAHPTLLADYVVRH